MTLNCTWREIMREAVQRLAAAGIDHPARDARLLLAHALSIEPVEVIIRETDAVDPVGLTAYEALIRRRLAREPVSRIRGWREFYGRRFIVTPDVLDPRPETELLVETGQKLLPPGGRVLDLGTGSGCILLSVLAGRSDAAGIGLDLSAAALAVARTNAAALGVSRASLVEGSWDSPAIAAAGPFDLALSNPPYITAAELESVEPDVRAYDPHLALVGADADGLGAYRAILAAMPSWLKPGGWIGVEFGQGQADAVARLMERAGLRTIEVQSDLAGIPRAAFGRSPG